MAFLRAAAKWQCLQNPRDRRLRLTALLYDVFGGESELPESRFNPVLNNNGARTMTCDFHWWNGNHGPTIRRRRDSRLDVFHEDVGPHHRFFCIVHRCPNTESSTVRQTGSASATQVLFGVTEGHTVHFRVKSASGFDIRRDNFEVLNVHDCLHKCVVFGLIRGILKWAFRVTRGTCVIRRAAEIQDGCGRKRQQRRTSV